MCAPALLLEVLHLGSVRRLNSQWSETPRRVQQASSRASSPSAVLEQAQLAMTDYLTQLPAELFITICELVRESSQGPYLGRISKAFLPVARRFTFRKVTVHTYAKLAKLCEVLIASPGAALYVNVLQILLPSTDVDNGKLKTATFNKAMRQLEDASTLTLQYSSRLVKSIFAPANGMLPSLQSLLIVDCFDGWSNPFDPINFHHLGRYRRLSRLDVEVKRSAESLGRYRPAKDLPKLAFGWSLWLTGPLSSNNAVSDLLSCFIWISSLGLCDNAPSAKATLPALLGKVNTMSSIQVLSLEQAADDPSRLVDYILNSPRLEALEFRHGTWSSAMLPVLHGLERLEELYFQAPGLSADELRAILDGPLRVIKLKKVVLNVVDYYPWAGRAVGWTPEFSLDGLVDLLPVAERVGVRLEGYAANRARTEVEKHEQRARKAAAATASRGGGS